MIKNVIGHYDLKFFEIVKTLVTSLILKVKIVVDDYDFENK